MNQKPTAEEEQMILETAGYELSLVLDRCTLLDSERQQIEETAQLLDDIFMSLD